jgi:4-amino-4-deoxy-L-arabinose transferase-like glycosyltransferase
MKLPLRFQKLIILNLTLLAFLLRAYRLEAQSYWIDEAWTVYFINLSPAELWRLLQTTEILPPFYYFPLIYWAKLAGEGEYGLRFYSLIFGVLVVPFTYRLGKALGDDRLGLMAALLMVVAPYQVWHSQDARMYSIFTAAAAMSMWGFVRVWQRGGWRSWLIYVIGSEWAILIHLHGLMLIGIQGLFLLLAWRRYWRDYWRWALALALIFMLFIPWLISRANLLQGFSSWVEQPTLGEAFARSAVAYSLNELVPPAQAMPLTLVFVTIYGLGLVTAGLRRWGAWTGPEMLAFLAAFTLAPPLAAWLYGEARTPIYLERYLIPVQIGYLLTVVVGVVGILNFGSARWKYPGARSLGGGALLLLVGINAWVLYHHYYDPLYAKENWREIVRKIEAFAQPGDGILLTGDGGEHAFGFYYRGNLPVHYDFNLLPPTHPDYKKGRKDLAELEQVMREITTGRERLWYTPYGVEIDGAISDWLGRHSYPAWHSWLGRKQLALYSTSPTFLDRVEQLQAIFIDPAGQGLSLIEVALPGTPVAAGDLLPLRLTWQAGPGLNQDYQLSLRLINPRSDIFVQSDWPPLTAEGGPTSTWPAQTPLTDRRSLWLPPETPPGEYLLQFVVYLPATGQAIGQPVTLEHITVEAAETVVPLEALTIPNLIPDAEQTNDSNPTLIGYHIPAEIQPGQEMWLWLYWQAQAEPVPDHTLQLSLQSEGESVSSELHLPDLAGSLATWQAGQVRRTVVHLPTSPRLNGKTAQVKLSLISSPKESSEITLAHINLATRSRSFELPALITYPIDISLGPSPELTLLGYDTSAKVLKPGDTLQLTLYWRAEAEMGINYTVFTQLLDPANQVVVQIDLQPQGGSAPTATWLPGEIVVDPYQLPLPADLLPGAYRLITGMYNPVTGERLPLTSGGNFVPLGEVKVE